MPCLQTLSVELRIEILSRLDARTLARLRCVSRRCSSLVSDPDFIALHRLRSQKNPLFLLAFNIRTPQLDQTRLYSLGITAPSCEKNEEGYTISPLVSMVRAARLELVCLWRMDTVLIFNPATKDLLNLPIENARGSFTYTIGFGYVQSTKQYKVLRIAEYFPDSENPERHFQAAHVMVLETVHVPNSGETVVAVGEGKWREAGAPPFLVCNDLAFADGSIHFGEHRSYSATVPEIAGFDIEEEEWYVRLLPVEPKSRDWHLTELGGRLCVVDFECTVNSDEDDTEEEEEEEGYTEHVNVWVLKDCIANVWEMEYKIDVSLLGLDKWVKPRPLAVEVDGRLLMEVDGGTILFYDPESRSFEDINVREKLSRSHGEGKNLRLTSYIESLLKLRG